MSCKIHPKSQNYCNFTPKIWYQPLSNFKSFEASNRDQNCKTGCFITRFWFKIFETLMHWKYRTYPGSKRFYKTQKIGFNFGSFVDEGVRGDCHSEIVYHPRPIRVQEERGSSKIGTLNTIKGDVGLVSCATLTICSRQNQRRVRRTVQMLSQFSLALASPAPIRVASTVPIATALL